MTAGPADGTPAAHPFGMRCWGVWRRPSAGLNDDLPGPPRIARLGTQAFLRVKVQIALDRQAETSAHGRQLLQTDPAEFGCSQAQVAQTEGVVVLVRVDLGQQPGRAGIRREQLDHGG